MVGPNGDFDHVLDDVPDGDDNDDGDVNMQDNDAGERAAPPENNGSRHNRDIDDEPPLEGYQRYVLNDKQTGGRAAYPSWIPSSCSPLVFSLIIYHLNHRVCRTDLIGQGAYGIVYKGIRQRTNETVAIKRIPFADSTPEGGVPCNVIREISLLRELDHPNVVQLLDIIQAHPGGLYLVFEYVAFDLKTFMDQQQTSDDISERVGLPVATVRSFMRQILAGVGFCHTYRVLHRDLKPHNVRSVLSWSDLRVMRVFAFVSHVCHSIVLIITVATH
jgi:hypothetical protein